MANGNKKCVICGKNYSYCPHCGEAKRLPTWLMIFCGEDCNTIYNTVVAWKEGNITTEEAYNSLSSIDVDVFNSEDFNPITKRQIDEIFSYKKNNNDYNAEGTDDNKDETVENKKDIVEEAIVEETKVTTKQSNKNRNGSKYNNNKSFYKNNK